MQSRSGFHPPSQSDKITKRQRVAPCPDWSPGCRIHPMTAFNRGFKMKLTQRNKMPPIERISELFNISENGTITRKTSAGNRRAGSNAERNLHGTEYTCVTIDGVRYLTHRVIWYFFTGDEPEYLDHINRNKRDNRLCNLRESSATDNRSNTDVMVSNSTGFIGVYWYYYKGAPKWRVACNDKHLGYFSSLINAVEAYNRYAAARYGSEAMVKIEHNRKMIKSRFGVEI